jgi:hypothetical protein
MEAPTTWCSELEEDRLTHVFTLEEALAFNWDNHIERLCSVTWGPPDAHRSGAFVHYHSGTWGPGTMPAQERCIQIGDGRILPCDLKQVYERIEAALRKANIAAHTIIYGDAFRTIWPVAHLKSLTIGPKEFKMCSCRADQWENPRDGGAALYHDQFRMASKIIAAWGEQIEEHEYVEEVGTKRKLDHPGADLPSPKEALTGDGGTAL